MTESYSNQMLWARTRDDLVNAIESLGFPAELGEAIAGISAARKQWSG